MALPAATLYAACVAILICAVPPAGFCNEIATKQCRAGFHMLVLPLFCAAYLFCHAVSSTGGSWRGWACYGLRLCAGPRPGSVPVARSLARCGLFWRRCTCMPAAPCCLAPLARMRLLPYCSVAPCKLPANCIGRDGPVPANIHCLLPVRLPCYLLPCSGLVVMLCG